MRFEGRGIIDERGVLVLRHFAPLAAPDQQQRVAGLPLQRGGKIVDRGFGCIQIVAVIGIFLLGEIRLDARVRWQIGQDLRQEGRDRNGGREEIEIRRILGVDHLPYRQSVRPFRPADTGDRDRKNAWPFFAGIGLGGIYLSSLFDEPPGWSVTLLAVVVLQVYIIAEGVRFISRLLQRWLPWRERFGQRVLLQMRVPLPPLAPAVVPWRCWGGQCQCCC